MKIEKNRLASLMSAMIKINVMFEKNQFFNTLDEN